MHNNRPNIYKINHQIKHSRKRPKKKTIHYSSSILKIKSKKANWKNEKQMKTNGNICQKVMLKKKITIRMTTFVQVKSDKRRTWKVMLKRTFKVQHFPLCKRDDYNKILLLVFHYFIDVFAYFPCVWSDARNAK